MKVKYTPPEMDIIQFDTEDVITTSGNDFPLSEDELEILGINLNE